MKKNTMKKLTVSALAATMAMSVAAPAFAGTLDFKRESNKGHTYQIYQIFTGDYDAEKKEMNNLRWGEDGTGYVAGKTEQDLVAKTIVDELSALADDDYTLNNQKKLNTIEKYFNSAENNAPIETASYGETKEVADGYYLIRDAQNPDGENEAYTTYVVRVVNGTVTIEPKVEVPGFDKQVLDEDETDVSTIQPSEMSDFVDKDGNTIIAGYWGESADHSINETFQFRLKATIPNSENMDEYESYALDFHDSLASQITFDGNVRVKVTAGGKSFFLTDAQFSTSALSSATDTNGNTYNNFTVSIADLKKVLTDNGVDSIRGAVVEVVYDAHLNETAGISTGIGESSDDSNLNKAHLEYSNNPNGGAGGDKGKTPEDTVYVFTYDVPNTKVAEDEKTPLAGAKFNLYDTEGNEIKLASKTDANGKVVYYPAGANDTAVEYMESPAEDGKFRLVGLDAGTYVLKETTPPDGYNPIDPMTIEITATHKEKDDASGAEVTKFSRKREGSEFTDNLIVNKKGSELPETGGMGTTLLYTLGGLMAVGAGATLATKKRVSRAKK